jgi:hypothetical protein
VAALGAQTRVALNMLHDIAKAMCSSLQIQALFRLGCTPAMIAAICRQSAGEPQGTPHP